MIDHNHPAVERMAHCMTRLALPDDDWERFYEDAAFMLREALPHLTADDLRNTEAGRVLLAEGWDEGFHEGIYVSNLFTTSQVPNPYKETPNE